MDPLGFIVVVFPTARQFRAFCELMGYGHHTSARRHRIPVRLALADLKSHSIALRAGARIAPSSRIIPRKP